MAQMTKEGLPSPDFKSMPIGTACLYDLASQSSDSNNPSSISHPPKNLTFIRGPEVANVSRF